MGLTSSGQSYKNSKGVPRAGMREHCTTLMGIGVLGFSLFIPAACAQERASDGPKVPNARSPLDEIQMAPARGEAPQWRKGGATNDTCLLPPLSMVRSEVVAAKALAVPARAKKEYMAACAALRKNKVDSAEKHLRKAVENYPQYPLAWTTLGQLLSVEKNYEQARSACSKASTIEHSYVPAYLCLADIAAREEVWEGVLQFSSQALQLDPSTTAAAYFYNAAANLKIHRLAEAEQSALRALAIDEKNSDPREHFLLAQIYEAKGDRPREISELREYLKFARNSEDIAYVKECLARLEKADPVHADSAACN